LITTSWDHSKRRWEERLSGPMKRCNKWCMSGCAHEQKTFFLEDSVHFVSTGELVSNAMETVEKWYTYVSLLLSKLWKRNIYGFHLTHLKWIIRSLLVCYWSISIQNFTCQTVWFISYHHKMKC
jgi:hypothetical protein